MIETVKNAWKIPDLRKKLLFVIVCIIIYRFGYSIYVPYVNVQSLAVQFAQNSGNLLGYFNVLAGGGLATASIFALSIYRISTARLLFSCLR